MKNLTILILAFSALLFVGCTNGTSSKDEIAKDQQISDNASKPSANDLLGPPTWAADATIYEVNLRQYTEEATFKSFLPHIPRLKDMGIDILWFMPIYPISKEKRKGELGSYYAVQDYTAVNEEEHGSLADFKEMVKEIHRADMKIILDYVPNHTGWDHAWITEHPEYYTKNDKGEIIDPIEPATGKSWGWTDVADLDYSNMEMRKAMTAEMKWWLTECDIDGFRMDVAHGVPTDFWDTCVKELMETKKVFLLAESEVHHLRNVSGFAADYGWEFHHLQNAIAEGTKHANDIEPWFTENRKQYNKGYHIHFTSNHDENSWNGTEFERMGEGHKAFAILSATLDGMPLVYSGQEEPIKKRLEFFKKDPIGFKNYAYADFYRELLALKKKNKALRNGVAGGEAVFLNTNNQDVVAYSREKEGDVIFTIINLSPKQQSIELSTAGLEGAFNNVFGSSTTSINSNSKFDLKPWDYLVLDKVN